MTPLQIFLAYSKMRGIMPKLHKMALDTRMTYNYNETSHQYERRNLKFYEIFEDHFKTYGFGGGMFLTLAYQYPYGGEIIRDPDVYYAARRWNDFMSRNIVYDGNLKVGSRVKYLSWGGTYDGVVESISKDFSRIKVTNGVGRTWSTTIGKITEVDGKPLDLSFHFKWKGKEYGKK
jgi:hypothetical protein